MFCYVVRPRAGCYKTTINVVYFSPFVDWKNVQRTLAIQNERLVCAAEPLFRLKVRGERLKAGSFYRFALKLILVYSVECCFGNWL